MEEKTPGKPIKPQYIVVKSGNKQLDNVVKKVLKKPLTKGVVFAIIHHALSE
jgi:hypothetical protein